MKAAGPYRHGETMVDLPALDPPVLIKPWMKRLGTLIGIMVFAPLVVCVDVRVFASAHDRVGSMALYALVGFCTWSVLASFANVNAIFSGIVWPIAIPVRITLRLVRWVRTGA